MKKRIGIEALLAWTYRDELPKAGAARALAGVGIRRAYSAIEAYGEYLSLIDCAGENRFGVVADLMAMAEPDIDAVRVYEAVQGLNDLTIVLPDDWNPLGDLVGIEPELPGLTARALRHISVLDANGVRVMKGGPSALIVKHAILGGCPAWEADQPERRFELGANSRPRWFRRILVETSAGPIESEVDGWDAKGKRPMAGAYRKTFLDPDPIEAVLGRAEYEVWHSALGWLGETLAGTLDGFDVVATERAARPWEEAPELAPRVLPNLRMAPAVRARVGMLDGKRRAA